MAIANKISQIKRVFNSPVNKKTERNDELFLDYLNGFGYLDLAIKYHVTTQRVAAIVKAVRAERIKKEASK